MTKEKHELGVPPTHRSKLVQSRVMAKFLVLVKAIPSPEEAIV
jgi:hypothetical protein